MIYKATGNLRAIQILLGHTKIENRVRYLGVDIEDALILAERTEIDAVGGPSRLKMGRSKYQTAKRLSLGRSALRGESPKPSIVKAHSGRELDD